MTEKAFKPFEQWDSASSKYLITEPISEELDNKGEATENETPSQEDSTEEVDTQNENPIPDSSLSEKSTDWEKRYRDLQSFKDKKIRELETKLKEATKKPVEIPKTAEELKVFAESNKEAYDYMLSMIRLELMQKDDDFKAQFEELKQTQAEIEKQKAIAKFKKYHPDIDIESLPKDEKFIAWFKTKSAKMQKEIQESDDPEFFAEIITLYKKETNIETKSKKAVQEEKLEATKTAKTTSNSAPAKQGKKTWTMAEITALSQKDFEKHETEIDEAFKEGRVIS